MTWNYRIIKFVDDNGDETHRAVHEVYYNNKMEPTAYSCKPAELMAIYFEDNTEDLKWVLTKMMKALDKHCLLESDFDTSN